VCGTVQRGVDISEISGGIVVDTTVMICLAAFALGDANAEQVCKQADVVVELAEKYEIEPEIIVSMVYHESRWNPLTRSRAGACGLTQIIPKWTKNPKLTCKQLKEDPALSLRTGIGMLDKLLISKKYADGNIKIALCAYNAGYSNCRSRKTARQSNRYGRNILRTAKKFKEKMLLFEDDLEAEVF
jgi:soluble lytic murein transglycosylase-like protein